MSFKQAEKLPDLRKFPIKVLLLGNQGTGKSSILHRQSGGDFTETIKSTIGASFSQTTVQCDPRTMVIMQVWDTAGQERFRSLVSLYYKNADAAILVYDITDASSFQGLQHWVGELRENIKSPMLAVVGNKIDLENDRKVTTNQGQKYADQLDAIFMETSAVSAKGIKEVFNKLGLKALENDRRRLDRAKALLTNGTDEAEDVVNLNSKKVGKTKKCC